ncbi:concanavalin A-like lectin protein kinase family protein [Anopheles sinensis]|uniref:Concanavalin A-like lectin protein kinase family protein n=1 Tax=Anopheles sinensis TaxID=74873 RepID=A0A084WGF4_ANOSI|nr:concanavalin A-like lectin protein kinase family protein [Anopheles sinensis]
MELSGLHEWKHNKKDLQTEERHNMQHRFDLTTGLFPNTAGTGFGRKPIEMRTPVVNFSPHQGRKLVQSGPEQG